MIYKSLPDYPIEYTSSEPNDFPNAATPLIKEWVKVDLKNLLKLFQTGVWIAVDGYIDENGELEFIAGLVENI